MTFDKNSTKRCFVFCPNPSIDILASIPKIEKGTSNRIQSEQFFPGGKGIHVALALAEMEIPTTLIGLWGDKNGEMLKASCLDFHPNLEIIGPEINGRNRSCYTFQSEGDWQDTELLGCGPEMNSTHFAKVLELIDQNIENMDSLAICGSWPRQAKSNYTQLIIDHCKKQNIPVYIDCTGPQLQNALKSKPFCLHLNRKEITEYFDTEFDIARKNILDFCEVAAITDGAKGLYLDSIETSIHANVQITNVKSTVGSGDCLFAGIIAGHYSGFNNENIAKLAVACGAANCLNDELGILKKETIDHLFLEVVSTNLN